ncbi:hypothetical protein ABZ456_25310 [Streptomyces sp. NPDC005776]
MSDDPDPDQPVRDLSTGKIDRLEAFATAASPTGGSPQDLD